MSVQKVGCLKPVDDLALVRFSQLEIYVILVFYAEYIATLLLTFGDNLSVWTDRFPETTVETTDLCMNAGSLRE
jgi:hypothetical protein